MRVSNKTKGMRFDCNRLWNWAHEKLGESKCQAIAFYWDMDPEAECGYYDWEKTIWIIRDNRSVFYFRNLIQKMRICQRISILVFQLRIIFSSNFIECLLFY